MFNRSILTVAFIATLCLVGSDCQAAEVYLSTQEALDVVFGKECKQKEESRALSPELLADLKSRRLLGSSTNPLLFYTCSREGTVVHYALIDHEIGKHLPMTYIVGILPSGEISRVELLVFREVRGWEVKSRSFMQQFENKNEQDELSIGGTLRNVSGATLSSRGIAKGVKRALYLWKHFFRNQS